MFIHAWNLRQDKLLQFYRSYQKLKATINTETTMTPSRSHKAYVFMQLKAWV